MSCGTSAGQFRAPQTSSAMDRNPILWAPSLFIAGVSGGKPCGNEGEWNIVYPNTQFKKEWGCHQAHMWARPPFRCGPCHSSTLLQPISMIINVSGPKCSNPVNWGDSCHCVSLCQPPVASEHWRVSPALHRELLCVAAISQCCSDWNKWQPWTTLKDKGISRRPLSFYLNLNKHKGNLLSHQQRETNVGAFWWLGKWKLSGPGTECLRFCSRHLRRTLGQKYSVPSVKGTGWPAAQKEAEFPTTIIIISRNILLLQEHFSCLSPVPCRV